MATIIVGGIVEKDGKYLLIQEAQEACRGKWFLQAGHLDPNETIFEGAIREIKEESGFDVELTGVCLVAHQVDPSLIGVYFSTKVIGGEISYDPEEILNAKWYSYEEIMSMREKLRAPTTILRAINNLRAGIIAPLEIINSQFGKPAK